jgi:Icc protein
LGWYRDLTKMPPLRLVVVGDIHHGQPTRTVAGDQALGLLEQVVTHLNGLPPGERPQLLVDLGDRITDQDWDRDRELQAEVAAVFAQCVVPRAHLLGNHDVATLSVSENEEILGQSLASASLDREGWHLVFWRANPVMTARGFSFAPGDLEWLEADLAASTLPTVVFTHAPFSGASLHGNYYFSLFPQIGGYADGHLAREVIERHAVAICLAGHVHWTSLSTQGGSHYLTVQSLSETFSTHPHPAGAWASLTLDARTELLVHGRERVRLDLPARQRGQSWLRMSEEQEAGLRAWIESAGG